MYVWLSQNKYSSTMTPFFQRPTVFITSLNDLPVGGMLVPSGSGMGRVKVPSITPMTLVHSPEPNLMGCTWMRVSGAYTNIAFKSSMWTSMPCV
jgi:hypothetical protein